MNNSIGRNIKHFRLRRGLTQKKLAEKAGITLHTLTKIESGTTLDPRVLTVKKILETLGISFDDLMQ